MDKTQSTTALAEACEALDVAKDELSKNQKELQTAREKIEEQRSREQEREQTHKAEMDEKDKEIDHLKNQIRELEDRIEQMEIDYPEIEKVGELKERVKGYKADLAEVAEKEAKYLNAIEMAETTRKNLNEELRRISDQRDQFAKENDKLILEITDMRNLWTEKMKKVDLDRTQLVKDQNDFMDEKFHLDNELSMKSKKLTEVTMELSRRHQEIKNMTLQYEEANEKKDELQIQYNKMKREADSIVETFNKLKRKNRQLTVTNADYVRKNEDLKTMCEEMKATLALRDAEIKRLLNHIESEKKVNDSLNDSKFLTKQLLDEMGQTRTETNYEKLSRQNRIPEVKVREEEEEEIVSKKEKQRVQFERGVEAGPSKTSTSRKELPTGKERMVKRKRELCDETINYTPAARPDNLTLEWQNEFYKTPQQCLAPNPKSLNSIYKHMENRVEVPGNVTVPTTAVSEPKDDAQTQNPEPQNEEARQEEPEPEQGQTDETTPTEVQVSETVNMVKEIPCRKPAIFKLGGGITFKNYLRLFDNWCRAANIKEGRKQIDILLTFLSPEAQMKAETMGVKLDGEVVTEEDIVEVRKKLLNALTDYGDTANAKVKLLNASQRSDESMSDYATRLQLMANEAYVESKKDKVKEEILYDRFITGIYDRALAIQVQLQKPTTFEEASKLAVELEASLLNRPDRNVKEVEDIMVVEESNNNRPSGSVQSNPAQKPFNPQIVCYRCNKLGHIRRNCTVLLQCKRCGGTNHITEKCDLLRQPTNIRDIPRFNNQGQNRYSAPNNNFNYRNNNNNNGRWRSNSFSNQRPQWRSSNTQSWGARQNQWQPSQQRNNWQQNNRYNNQSSNKGMNSQNVDLNSKEREWTANYINERGQAINNLREKYMSEGSEKANFQ